jgi:hypothetical protein
MENPEDRTGLGDGAWSNSRRYIRFKPDTSTYAAIDTRSNGPNQPFVPEIMGLIYEESSHGCGMILIGVDKLSSGDVCRIQIGSRTPIDAEVRWTKEIDPDVIRIGFLYLEDEVIAG